jgi:hypothetical protein
VKSIDRFTNKEIIDILNKCWMSHDGMWFNNCLQEFGIEIANKLNKASIKNLSGIEIKRILNAFEIEKGSIDNFEQFKRFFIEVSGLFIPDFMNVSWTFPENNIVHWEFKKENCFAYYGIKKLGVIENYECGVIFRLECWLNELGIKYEVNPKIKNCLMLNQGNCSGDIYLRFK